MRCSGSGGGIGSSSASSGCSRSQHTGKLTLISSRHHAYPKARRVTHVRRCRQRQRVCASALVAGFASAGMSAAVFAGRARRGFGGRHRDHSFRARFMLAGTAIKRVITPGATCIQPMLPR